MPRGDKTGPNGQGPQTGRGAGFCAGNDKPGFMEQGVGFRGGGRFRAPQTGYGRGLGRGRGFAWRAQPQNMQAQPQPQEQEMTEEQEKQLLKQDLEDMKKNIKVIEQRLKELKR